jgi:hypothetical protein
MALYVLPIFQCFFLIASGQQPIKTLKNEQKVLSDSLLGSKGSKHLQAVGGAKTKIWR